MTRFRNWARYVRAVAAATTALFLVACGVTEQADFRAPDATTNADPGAPDADLYGCRNEKLLAVTLPAYEACSYPKPLPSGACAGADECDGHTISLWCLKPNPEDMNPAYIFEMRQSDGSFVTVGRSVYPYYDPGYGLSRLPEVFFRSAVLGATYTFRVCRENADGKTCGATFDVKNRDEVCPPPPPPPPDYCLKCFKLPNGHKICCDTCTMPYCRPAEATPIESTP